MMGRVVLLLLLLVGGAVVNVAVAWGISQTAGPIVFNQVRVPRFGEFHWSATKTWWSVTYLNEAGMAYLKTWQKPADFVPDPKKVISAEDLPRWSRLRQPQADAGEVFLPHWREYARGWPLLAMFLRMEEDTTIYKHVSFHAIDAPLRTQRLKGFARRPEEVLPLGIIWPGFAINTVFYALVLWLLFAATFALRRRRRIKRGLCPKCGYNLRGIPATSDACPECGAPRIPHAVRQPEQR